MVLVICAFSQWMVHSLNQFKCAVFCCVAGTRFEVITAAHANVFKSEQVNIPLLLN